MLIAVGSDHRGDDLRSKLVALLLRLGQEVEEVRVDSDSAEGVDYPDIAEAVARKVGNGDAQRGVLICGTGLGMCIAANKVPGVRAAPCHDVVTIEVARRHNDLNVLCLPGDIVDEKLLDRLIETWIDTPFDGGRHARRNEKIDGFQNGNGHSPDV
ncbi:MAG TPA: RpiB/LacA/LacB family sugar-phosphate isomerase [Thermoguttaceae bacterium]|nr:RpiB/LacA/LacB family sugar-phosphate isomerase [Thermoguttaceae bacterium]